MGRRAERCRDCARKLIAQRAWRAMSPPERAAADGQMHAGRGLCNACYHVVRWREKNPDSRPMRSADEVLEEWELLRSDGVTDLVVAARRIGMSPTAFKQALYRARRRGDARGNIYRNDQLGSGTRLGTTNQGQQRRVA